MTKAQIILSMPGASKFDVAAAARCHVDYVSNVRRWSRAPETKARYLDQVKHWQRNNREIVRANCRDHYHRTKVLGGPAQWTPTLDRKLKTFIAKGQSFSAIAKAMGFSRSAIAGRAYRLKKAGLS